MQEKATGIVVFYLPAKGYGYVRLPGTNEEFRFRTRDLHQPVQAGDHVSFVITQNRSGYWATDVTLLSIA